jgi:hypothetical protein
MHTPFQSQTRHHDQPGVLVRRLSDSRCTLVGECCKPLAPLCSLPTHGKRFQYAEPSPGNSWPDTGLRTGVKSRISVGPARCPSWDRSVKRDGRVVYLNGAEICALSVRPRSRLTLGHRPSAHEEHCDNGTTGHERSKWQIRSTERRIDNSPSDDEY